MKIRRTENLYPVEFKPTAIPEGFILVIDTREQEPLFLPKLPKGLTVIRERLKCGDYSVRGFEDKITIERKKMSDFISYIGKERERTIEKLKVIKEFYFSALVIETNNPYNIPIDIPTKITPEVIRGALKSFRVKYRMHIYWSAKRKDLEMFVLDHLTYAYKQLRGIK